MHKYICAEFRYFRSTCNHMFEFTLLSGLSKHNLFFFFFFVFDYFNIFARGSIWTIVIVGMKEIINFFIYIHKYLKRDTNAKINY